MNNYYNPYGNYQQRNNRNIRENNYGMVTNRITTRDCENRVMSAIPENAVVAMAYVPFQLNNETYNAREALCNGTIFPVLDKPFTGCCK